MRNFLFILLLSFGLFSTSFCKHIQYRVSEFTFTSKVAYTNPFDYEEVEFKAVFHGPAGETIPIFGFWDGGNTWKIRFTPLSPGTWTYTTSCSNTADRGLHNQSGSLEADVASGPQLPYLHGGFLKSGTDGHYLTYTDGTPFFFQGDVPWPLPSFKIPLDNTGKGPRGYINPRIKEAKPGWDSPLEEYLSLRKSQDYTAIMGRYTYAMWEGGPEGIDAINNDSPDDLIYWQSVDPAVELLAEKGFIYFSGATGYTWLNDKPLSDIKKLWRYILARYGAYPSVYYFSQEYNWMGVHNPDKYSELKERVLAIGDLVAGWDGYQRALGLHPYSKIYTLWQPEWDRPWLKFLLNESGHNHLGLNTPIFTTIYNHPDKSISVFEIEFYWEGMTISGPVSSDTTQRKGAYESINSGNAGYGYGALGIYSLDDGTYSRRGFWGPPVYWWEALDWFPGQRQMSFVQQCYCKHEWWRLKPRPDAVEHHPKLLTKSINADLFYIWYPVKVSIRGNARLLGTYPEGAVYTGEWFNVRDGSSIPINEITVGSDNKLVLPAKPDNNDWMLILSHRKQVRQ